MKKAAIFVVTAILFAVCLPAFAAQFPDVPTDHWAYAAVQDLADKGVIVGYPDGTFGGKRALTRYEFAQALSRAIPVIAKMAGGAGVAGAQGPAGPQGPAGITPEELANINRLINEFRDELAAQGVDIQALKKDVAALADRVAALEAEQQRVKITAEVPIAWEGRINNSGNGFDRDGRSLGSTANPLSNNDFFNDLELSIKGKVSNSASVTALIAAGNYLPFAIDSTSGIGVSQFGFDNEQFNLFNLYLNAAVGLGPLGGAQVTAGRFPFQLTPLTMKFVNPDSYIYVSKLQNGDFAIDGGTLQFKLFGKANTTLFAGKAVSSLGLDEPLVLVGSADRFRLFNQFAGARTVIGVPLRGTLGLTNYVAGNEVGEGKMRMFGADLKATFFGLGFAGEYAKSDPSDGWNALEGGVIDAQNEAWNANLRYQLGRLAVGGGYSELGRNYIAPGYWNRAGQAVNMVNVKGWNANLGYTLSNRLQLLADGQFLEPKNGSDVPFRFAGVFDTITATNVDKLDAWKVGLKYGLTASNSVDLGWEEAQWKALTGSGTKERYYTFGLGHTFNANSSLKLLYQIIDYKAGTLDAIGAGGNYRGGMTAAEFLLEY